MLKAQPQEDRTQTTNASHPRRYADHNDKEWDQNDTLEAKGEIRGTKKMVVWAEILAIYEKQVDGTTFWTANDILSQLSHL